MGPGVSLEVKPHQEPVLVILCSQVRSLAPLRGFDCWMKYSGMMKCWGEEPVWCYFLSYKDYPGFEPGPWWKDSIWVITCVGFHWSVLSHFPVYVTSFQLLSQSIVLFHCIHLVHLSCFFPFNFHLQCCMGIHVSLF